MNAVQNGGDNSSGSRRMIGTNNQNNSSPESSHSTTSNSPAGSRHAGLVARGSGSGGKKPDFMDLMIMQMNNKATKRAFEGR